MSLYNASEEASAPATPSAARQVIYPKSGGWYSKNDAGTEYLFLVNGGALGTPASGYLTSCTSNTESANNNSTQLATTAYADRLTAGTLPGAFTALSATNTISSIGDGTSVVKIGSSTYTSFGAGIAHLWMKGTNASNPTRAGVIVFDSQSGTGGANALYSAAGVLAIYAGATNNASLAQVGAFSTTGLAVTGQVSASAHNTYDLGTTGVRWKDLWLQSGAFNGSDARLKTSVSPLSTNEINAAKQLSKEIGTYQWLESVASKGEDKARYHVGLTVQRAIEIMIANGLDWTIYGFIGYDQWADEFIEHAEILPIVAKDAVLGVLDNIIEPAIEAVEGKAAWTEHKTVAGDAYSFRYDQLNMFVAAGLEARLAALEVL